MPYVLGRYVDGFVEMSWPMRALLLTIATIVTASISWRCFEAPILGFKDRWSAQQSRSELEAGRVYEAA